MHPLESNDYDVRLAYYNAQDALLAAGKRGEHYIHTEDYTSVPHTANTRYNIYWPNDNEIRAGVRCSFRWGNYNHHFGMILEINSKKRKFKVKIFEGSTRERTSWVSYDRISCLWYFE